MRGYVGNTDFDWYQFLKSQSDLDEVNFWQPSGRHQFQAVPAGAPFFFRLKKPYYAIAGFGFFARGSILPAWLAWEAFERANGAPDFATMVTRIAKYRGRANQQPTGQEQVGCLMISEPVFFEEHEWILQPADWSSPIVQGKTYDLTVGEGQRIYEQCIYQAALRREKMIEVVVDPPRYGSEQIIRPRLGQGTFRVAVLDAYGRACAVSGEHSLPVLQAAHIKPYSAEGQHEVSNGILLRADIHRLFDMGYVTVTPEHRFEVSRRLKEDFSNGRTYYPIHGQPIRLPANPKEYPERNLLDWHNREKFLG
ncbi:MAG: HNH endonuclease [Acidobacteriota bacterium]